MVYTFYIIVFLILITFFANSLKGQGISFFFRNTICLGSIFFFLIHILMPILQKEVDFFRYPVIYTDFDFILSLFASFFIFVSFFSIFNITMPSFSQIKVQENFVFKYFIFSFFIFLIGSFFTISNLLDIFSMGLDVYLSDRISFGYGEAYKMLLSDWVYVSAILFFIGIYISPSTKWVGIFKFAFLISFIYTVFYYSITGNRNSIFVILVVLSSLYFILKKKNISFLFKVFIGFCVSIVFYLLHYVGQQRSSGFQGGEKESTSFKDFVESFNGAFGNHENILWLVSNTYDYQYGVTYLAAFTNFIPRFIWLDKPLGAGPRLKNFIYPGSYIPGQEGNSSLTTGLVTEALINFNFIFSIVFVIIFAFILKLIVKKLIKSNNLLLALSGVILAICISTLMLYSEFLGFLSRIIFMILPILIAAIFFKIRILR
ncbi:O-antigen polymerase [Acinetobacter pittii]|uniref:O-antigen polymerase n=1 Tax=Acinetobacter pittii TaxID=48296 RepID=UPI0018FFAC93|nr:O-antigen polymerase [Acinetobacter pittii]MBJ8431825.1 oligosaccharide repeat unit polymerase [Acinetobacter pittii]